MSGTFPQLEDELDGELEVQARYRIVRALADSERRARLRVEGLIEIVFEVDDGLTLTFVNGSWERVLGPRQGPVGRGLLDFVRAEDHAAVRSVFEGVVDGAELQMLESSGELRPMQLSVAKVEANSWVCALFDVRDRKLAQARVEAMNRDLEIRIGERTAQLDREIEERERLEVELRLAHKFEAVGQLAAGIAHEINTPLQYVGNSLEFLEFAADNLFQLLALYRNELASLSLPSVVHSRIEEGERASDYEFITKELPLALTRTREGAERVQDIVRSIQDFSHPDAQEPEMCSLEEVVQVALMMVQSEGRGQAVVTVELEPNLVVEGYPGALKQVLVNLLMNSFHAIGAKARPEGEKGCITVKTQSRGADVLISVEDDGGGIPTALLERIYDPFFTTKAVGEGTGQGLTIARRIIVDRHGGRMWVEKPKSGGCRFCVELPRRERPASERDQTRVGGP